MSAILVAAGTSIEQMVSVTVIVLEEEEDFSGVVMLKAAGFQSLQGAYNGRQHWLLGSTAEHATSVVADFRGRGER